MADINVERKGGTNWLWWILGLIVLALLIWWLVDALGDNDTAEVPVGTDTVATAPMTPAPMPAAPAAAIPIADIVANPAQYQGQQVNGTVVVSSVPTNRGFWVEDAANPGQRLLVVLNDQPAEQPKDINPGQTLQLSNATVMTSQANLPGTLDQDTKNLLNNQPAFLNVDESNVQISAGGVPQPGTTPAQTAPGGMSGDTTM